MPNQGHHSGHHSTGRDGRHWTALKPSRSYAAGLYLTLGLGLVLLLMALASYKTLGHSAGGLGFMGLLAVCGLLAIAFAAYRWLVYRNLEDAKVLIDRPELVVGEGFSVRVEQRARRGLHIHEMRVGLICQETLRQATAGGTQERRTVPLLEKWETLTREKKIEHARDMTATRLFRVPPDRPASSPIDHKGLPLIRWKLRVVTTAAHAPTYDVEFPVRVHGTPSEGFWREINSDELPPIRRL